MAAGDEDLGGHVLVPAVHAVDAPAAPLLLVVVVGLLALDVAEVGHGDHALLLGNQVLDIHLAADGGNLRAALVGELALHLQGLVLDDGQPPALAGQDGVEVGDVGVELVQLVFNLQNLQPSQLAQLELADGVGLQIVKAEALHQRGLGLGPAALAGPDGGDDLVHNVDGLFQALQNVGAVLGLFQVELGAAGDDLHLELDVLLQNLPQVQQLGLALYNGQHNHAKGGLHLGEVEQVV